MEGCKDDSIILLDSLTDLSRLLRFDVAWEDIIDLIAGFKKVCIKRNILLMAILTANVLDKSKEEEIFDVADAVFVFEWEMEKDSIKRWLYFRKFLGVLPLLEKQMILKYNA
ncbi:hypothetical protein DRP05_14295 [Archaeoglobales archaeon]|nr:MAG: hypothetical protein DRP05_14295 [Archaeoglobales archaeon]